MNKKGQQVGTLIVVAIAVIVGVIFFQVIAQQVGSSTNTVAVANTSLALVVNDTAQYLTDYKSISSVVIYNETNATGGTAGIPIIGSGNYTVTNNYVNNGALTVRIVPDATAGYKSEWQVSGTAEPTTYISNSGGRAVAGLIAVFFALAVLAAAMFPGLRDLKGI